MLNSFKDGIVIVSPKNNDYQVRFRNSHIDVLLGKSNSDDAESRRSLDSASRNIMIRNAENDSQIDFMPPEGKSVLLPDTDLLSVRMFYKLNAYNIQKTCHDN